MVGVCCVVVVDLRVVETDSLNRSFPIGSIGVRFVVVDVDSVVRHLGSRAPG